MIALVVLDLPHSVLVENEAHLPHPILDKKEDTRPCNSSLTILKPDFGTIFELIWVPYLRQGF